MNKNLYILILLCVTIKCSGQYIGGTGFGNIDNKNSSLYWAGTIFFSAINATTTAFNIIKIKKSDKSDKYKSNAVFGIISGSLQVAIGIANVSATYKNAFIPTSINIGLGVSTIVTSIIRLAKKNHPEETKLVYNFFYVPTFGRNTSTIVLTVIRRIN
jgi:hypothetical protein